MEQDMLFDEFEILYDNYWENYLNKTYELKADKINNRTKLKPIIGIDTIKKIIYNKVGVIPIFIFLTSFCNQIKIPGPYNYIEKCLLVIFQLIEGYNISEMKLYTDTISGSSYYNIYESIFIKEKDKLNEWIDNMMKNMFSNVNIRNLSSKINNPVGFEHITLYLDGHHNRITLEDIDIDKTELYSYKLQKNGLNTQFIIDCNNMAIFISDSKECKMNNDDKMFINNVYLNKFFSIDDCLCFDGLYENSLKEVIQKYNNAGLRINIDNFCFPIRYYNKKVDKPDEIKYNNEISGFRSRIENYFADISKTFKRLDPQNKVRVTKIDTYNLQLKFCCLLLNIKRFVEIYPYKTIFENIYYSLWMEKGFDLFNSNNPQLNLNNINISEVTQYHLNLRNIKQNSQNDFIENLKKNKNLNINKGIKQKMDVDYDDTIKENYYEVQYIITHRGYDETLEFLVKWKGYAKKVNSWVKPVYFSDSNIIVLYWKSLEK
jgi:hypothetical protein